MAEDTDLTIIQNFIDWNIDPRSRAVTVDKLFGTVPLHLKHDDDFSWRIHFKIADADAFELANLTSIEFVLLEKGRYDGVPLAQGTADGSAWEARTKSYLLNISFNLDTLTAYLATLQATTTDFSTGSFDCKTAEAKAAGTVATSSTANGVTTTTTAPGATTPSTLTDLEFMGEFRWMQQGKQMRSQTFSIFVARDLIQRAPAAAILNPPPIVPVDWRFFASLVDGGSPFNGALFGYLRAPMTLEVLGLQVAVLQPDPNHGFRVQLTDTAGTPLGDGNQFFGDVPANTPFVNLPFGQVLALAQNGEIRATILNYDGVFTDNSVVASGLTVNLLCRQYSVNSPAGPSGPPAITSAEATTLAAGAQATAQIIGQVLKLGLPRGNSGNDGVSPFDTIAATSLAPNLPATAKIVARVLQLGIPKGDVGSYMHYSAPAANPVAYSAASTAVASCTFVGIGKPALIILVYRNMDVNANETDVFWNVTRTGQAGTILAGGQTLAAQGNTYPIIDISVDPQTPVGNVTYTLNVGAYSGGLPGNANSHRAQGLASAPLLVVLEIVN